MRSIATGTIVFLGLSIGAVPEVVAFDNTGHKIVANIAAKYLSPEVFAQVTAMLEADSDKTTAPDIASAATWADKVQDGRSHNWHFAHLGPDSANTDAACFGHSPLRVGVPASQGPEQACIIDKITQFSRELAAPTTTPEERILALKFLLHLVADAHQPLRVTDQNDSHGMRSKIVTSTTTPGTLFTYWDKTLIIELNVDDKALTQKLLEDISANDRKHWASGTPQQWVMEAHELGVSRAYGMVGNLDAQGNSIISDADVVKASQIVATQLSKAGVRLAYVLNEALAPKAADRPK